MELPPTLTYPSWRTMAAALSTTAATDTRMAMCSVHASTARSAALAKVPAAGAWPAVGAAHAAYIQPKVRNQQGSQMLFHIMPRSLAPAPACLRRLR